MRIKKYDKLYQLTVFPHVFPINSYVYEEDNFLIVIDIGTKMFVNQIDKLSRQLNKKVKYLILTHPHKDHMGGLQVFQKQFPDTQLCISKRDRRLLMGDYSLDTHEAKEELKGGFIIYSIALPICDLLDGDKIGALRVIDTIGHTPGSISLHSDDNKVLIVGDAIQTFRGVAIAGDMKLLFPFPTLATWSSENAILSAEKIMKIDFTYLATGHGNVIKNPKEKILKSINIMKEKNK
jgi:glyoxylase-like metal-dependent hydrolase (beta-lactamase superfamily II)